MDYFFRLRFLILINLMFFFIHHLKIFYLISLNFFQSVSYLLNFLNLSNTFTIIVKIIHNIKYFRFFNEA